MATATVETSIHCFEKAGLGKAPFRYVGEEYQDIRYGSRVIGSIGGCAVETKPGGTCAYCSTYIVNMFVVESSDGNRFHVGCECIKKTGDAGLVRKVEAAVKKMNRERREAKKKLEAEVDRQLCETAQIGLLSDKPHPHPFRAANGETLADWARFMIEHKNWKSLARVIRHYIPQAK